MRTSLLVISLFLIVARHLICNWANNRLQQELYFTFKSINKAVYIVGTYVGKLRLTNW